MSFALQVVIQSLRRGGGQSHSQVQPVFIYGTTVMGNFVLSFHEFLGIQSNPLILEFEYLD